MKKRILVTGGAGFIGSHLVRNLLEEGIWHITVVDNFNDFYSPSIKRRNVADFVANSDFDLHEIDICDRSGLESVFRSGDFSHIVHLAARAGVRPSLERPDLYVETNINGTLNLLELAREFQVPKFVFGSSSSVYGSRCQIPFVESDDVSRPISPYAATKVAGEALGHSFAHLFNINVVCLRFFTVYGASQRPDLAIHKFAALIDEGSPIPVFGDGTTRRDYTYVDDVIHGIMAAVAYEGPQFDVFNIGESRTVELRELIGLLENALGKEAIIDRQPLQPGDVPLTCADLTKSRDLLGYDPQTQIEEGITEFVKWFRTERAGTAEPIIQ